MITNFISETHAEKIIDMLENYEEYRKPFEVKGKNIILSGYAPEYGSDNEIVIDCTSYRNCEMIHPIKMFFIDTHSDKIKEIYEKLSSKKLDRFLNT